jgi:Dr1-associated corepressor
MARRITRATTAAQQHQHQHQQQLAFDHRPLSLSMPQPVQPQPPPPVPVEPTRPLPWAGVEVKTKFPVARIKRIMQADEDVGKVAQVTPIAVGMSSSFQSISFAKYTIYVLFFNPPPRKGKERKKERKDNG